MNLIFGFRQAMADVITGLGLTWINDLPGAFWPTFLLIFARIVLEWLILKNKMRKKE
jgi:hypothetical protein